MAGIGAGGGTTRLDRAAQISLIVLGVCAAAAALQYAESLLAPVVLALVIGVVLSPISDFWERIGAPRVIGALTSLMLTLGFVIVLVMLVQPVAFRVVSAWPTILSETRGTLVELQTAFEGLRNVGQEVDRALTGDAPPPTAAGPADTSVIAIPDTADALFLAPAVLGQTAVFAGTLFFFLLTRQEVYAWIARRIAPDTMTHDVAIRLRLAERQVARYFLTITVINTGLGVAVTAGMTALGMPEPYVWGAAATLLNFILYLGPAMLFGAFVIAGMVQFDGIASLLPALVYGGMNLIEAQFVTPAAVGKRLSVNPLLVFLALIAFLWFWGPLGGIVAIPLLLWAMVLANEIRMTRDDIAAAEREATEIEG
ncbi:hypothetical protein OCGS_2204 [Oceaniovalibus guishaninsula JLT2003]|uniref:Permease n=1 Tax=Oceaniovalibus guishaninsula JLT2003 TaxID=1231392 RepID=K2HA21_9RHOB|nr:AI-2E family transporter [Oceaniovalibus guishaninsula]EKE43472.1 hypothetical protein OCGS_2204 [Oceaniovalibus guishaninsula JLT2003]